MDISEKNEANLCIEYLSGHQVLSIDKVLCLLLWLQWRIKIAENLYLIQFISQTSSVTPDFFYIETFLYL